MRLEDTVKELMGAVVEEKWFGFKENWYEPTGIGEYISSHSNATAMVGKEKGYLVWGATTRLIHITGSTPVNLSTLNRKYRMWTVLWWGMMFPQQRKTVYSSAHDVAAFSMQ